MSDTSSGLPSSASVLQRRFSLGELIDVGAFREVCESYAELFRIGFKILDARREMLVDVKGGSGDFCAYVFNFPEGKAACMREVGQIRELELAGPEVRVFDCFTGLRYLVSPIQHEGDLVGRVIFGPYRPAGRARPVLKLGERFNPEVAGRLLGLVPEAPDEVALKVVRHLCRVVEVMLFTGYKQILTSRMHVESVSASYNELQAKNQQLRESYERLKELDRLKSSFLATVSHELRTPLTSVIGYSEMLLEGLAGPLAPEQHEYVKTIMDKGENLLQLISGILDFSKVESGNLRLSPDQADLRDVVQAALTTVLPLARKNEVRVECELPDQVPTLVRLDAGKIRQALVNILGNAVKFNRKGGVVRLSASLERRPCDPGVCDDVPAALQPVDEAFLRLDIVDTGIGIPEDQLGRVFDSFYQVDSSSTREYGGTGLGLAISRSFVEAHGGQVEVRSALGQGSTFSILLPMSRVGL
jgi:signal transduction histidine kinase